MTTPGISGNRTVFVSLLFFKCVFFFFAIFTQSCRGDLKICTVAVLLLCTQCLEHVNQVAVYEQQTFIHSLSTLIKNVVTIACANENLCNVIATSA